MPEPVVVVMAKAPRAGEVKTRLVPSLTPAEAASLAASFVRDTVKTAKEIVANVLIAYAPTDARIELEPILPMDLLSFQQQGDNLGERLHYGADSPDLPIAFLREALDVLTAGQADVALGPQKMVVTTSLAFVPRFPASSTTSPGALRQRIGKLATMRSD